MKTLTKSLSLEQTLLNLDLNQFTKWCKKNQLKLPVKRINKDQMLGKGKYKGKELLPLQSRLKALIAAYQYSIHPDFLDITYQASPSKPLIGYYEKLPNAYQVYYLNVDFGNKLLTERTWASWRTKTGLRKGSAEWKRTFNILGLHALVYPQP
jgi:hypothetical protein